MRFFRIIPIIGYIFVFMITNIKIYWKVNNIAGKVLSELYKFKENFLYINTKKTELDLFLC